MKECESTACEGWRRKIKIYSRKLFSRELLPMNQARTRTSARAWLGIQVGRLLVDDLTYHGLGNSFSG